MQDWREEKFLKKIRLTLLNNERIYAALANTLNRGGDMKKAIWMAVGVIAFVAAVLTYGLWPRQAEAGCKMICMNGQCVTCCCSGDICNCF